MKKYSILLFLVLYMIYPNSFARGFTLESSAFKMNSMIPNQYTCKGSDQFPPLNWQNIPINTKSFALIVEDPDGPDGQVWTHLILYNIPNTVLQLPAGNPTASGAMTAPNSWGELGYRGPCPSVGIHIYHFKLYALDKVLNLDKNATQNTVLNAITSHVIGSTELVGLYQVFE